MYVNPIQAICLPQQREKCHTSAVFNDTYTLTEFILLLKSYFIRKRPAFIYFPFKNFIGDYGVIIKDVRIFRTLHSL